jgi:cell division protein FtsN
MAFINKESDAINKSDAEVNKDVPDEAKMSMTAPASEKKEDVLKTEIQKFEEARKTKEAKEVKEEKGAKEQQEQKEQVKPMPEVEKTELLQAKEIKSELPPSLSKKKGSYTVQAGVFKQKKNVDDLRRRFVKEGYPVKVVPIITQGESTFKVMVGEFATKNDAEAFVLRLKKTEDLNAMVKMSEVTEKVQTSKADILKATGEKEKKKPSVEPEKKKTADIKAEPSMPSSLTQKGVVYSVQAGAYKKRAKAETLRNKYEKAGYPAKVATVIIQDESIFKVMIGEFSTKEDADEFAMKLKRTDGLDTIVRMTEVAGKVQIAEADLLKKEIEKEIEKEKEMEITSVESGNHETGQTIIGEKENEIKIQISDKERLQGSVDSYEGLEVKIRDKTYTVSEIFEYMTSSLSLTHKLNIPEVLWRKGDTYEDFTNEHLLYHEAKDLLIIIDEKKLNDIAGHYNLNTEEAEYLNRFLMISELIDIKIKELPEERFVESLTVWYKGINQQAREEFAKEIQTSVKNSVSFEDISKSHPDVIQFQVISWQDLEGWIKERIISLPNGEIGMIWTEEGSMILKPVLKKLSYNPFEDSGIAAREKIKDFVKDYISELRKDMKSELPEE